MRSKKFTLPLMVMLILFSSANAKNKLLIFLAHPDDETLIAQYLLELDRNQWNPTIIYLTAGEGGSDRRWDQNSIPLNRKELLKKIRLEELKDSMEVLKIEKYFVLNIPDLPHRVPTPAYSNPLGKPTTNLNLFLKEVYSWNPDKVMTKLKKVIHKNSLQEATHILTMCDCAGFTHAHHQATNYIVKKLVDQKYFKKLKSAMQFGEQKSYPEIVYPEDQSRVVTMLKAQEMNSELFSQYYQVYQAHQSQGVSLYSKEKLKTFTEKIWGL